MESKIMTVTPLMAKEWLERANDEDNRPLMKRYVSYLAGEMKSDNWRLTHQGVAFNSDEHLVDGQHRLSAIVEANKPIQMLVTTGLPGGRFPIIDRGVARSLSVVTKLPGFFTEIYGLLLSIIATTGSKLSPDDISSLHESLGAYSEALKDCCPTATRFFSSAPIRSAAVIAIVSGESKSYVFNTYRNLVLQNLEILPHVALSLVRQYNRGLLQFRGAPSRKAIYAKARYLFTEKNQGKMTIHIGDILMDEYMNEVKLIVNTSLK